MDLSFVMYQSTSKYMMDGAFILKILGRSVTNNCRDGLTGFLHAHEYRFLQYLEGPHDALMTRLAKIRQDPRHGDFMILADGTTEERLFPYWDMGQIEPDSPKVREILKSWHSDVSYVDPLRLIMAFAEHASQTDSPIVVPQDVSTAPPDWRFNPTGWVNRH